MPHYYFDIKDGHRFVDPSGSDLVNDDAAIAKAKVLAIGVSIDTPAVDPERHIAVLNGSREEIFRVCVYSKPLVSNSQAFDRCHDPASGVAASCQFNKGQFGKQRLARRWCRFC